MPRNPATGSKFLTVIRGSLGFYRGSCRHLSHELALQIKPNIVDHSRKLPTAGANLVIMQQSPSRMHHLRLGVGGRTDA